MRTRKGFTLAELLIVVAIIGVLAAISIPIFGSSLEKSREATDIANIRSAYAEVMMAAVSGETPDPITIDLEQKKADWDTLSAEGTFNKLTDDHVAGSIVDGSNTATVEWLADEQAAKITFNGGGSSGGSEGGSPSGGGSEEPEVPGSETSVPSATAGSSFEPGTVLKDDDGTWVIVSGGTWSMRNNFDKGQSASEAFSGANIKKVNPSDVKDSSYTGTLTVGDIYYDSDSETYYYVSYVGSEKPPATGWVQLLQ